MKISCKQCGLHITNNAENMLRKNIDKPSNALCNDCQHKNRLLFRNERVLYTRKCDGTGKKIVSNISPDSPYTVYSLEYWNSDNWDPMTFGKEYDFDKSFFEQYKGLNKKIPRQSLMNIRPENSDYCNMCVDNKNCYLVFGGDFNQDCMYTTMSMKDRDCLDIDYTNDSELCYMTDNSVNCYGCRFLWDSKNCTNCFFSTDLISCEECIFCSNLNNKKYCINNKQLGKEEYQKLKQQILSGSYIDQQQNWERLKDLRRNRIVKYGHIISSENVSGDYIKNCKNCINCLDATGSEDIFDAIYVDGAKDCSSIDFIGHNAELVTNSVSTIMSTNIFGSFVIDHCADIYYSEQCFSSHDLFGCNGLRSKQYCILNKQYSREDYFELRDKIIEQMKNNGEWGQFFPRECTPNAYNEGTCMRYFPLTKEQALNQGYTWREADPKSYQVQTMELPDNIDQTKESITNEILACESCQKNYKILAAELNFYRNHHIPIPRLCPECRFHMRHSLRNPFTLYESTCAKCGQSIQTTYAPNRPETVYCEKCYLNEIY